MITQREVKSIICVRLHSIDKMKAPQTKKNQEDPSQAILSFQILDDYTPCAKHEFYL